MKIKEILDRLGNSYNGNVCVSLQNRKSVTMVRAVLRKPMIERTALGVSFTSGDQRFDIDFRDVTETKTDDEGYYYRIENKELGLVMSLLFVGGIA